MNTLVSRKATLTDLPSIIDLLLDDDLGQVREKSSQKIDQRYVDAFHRIDSDPNQYLMVVIMDEIIIATCHLSLMPSLTFVGSTRMQIEAVRVSANFRGQKIGEWMINEALDFAKKNQVSIVQLTTNKQRSGAIKFYERLGFQSTHKGMKYYFS